MVEFKSVACVVCEAEVLVQANVTPPEPPTCIEHYFHSDPTEAWEVEE